MSKKRYYYLTWDERDLNAEIANAPPDSPLAYEFFTKFAEMEVIPFNFELVQEKHLRDYLGNSMSWPLMSKRLKDVIDKNLKIEQGIRWIIGNIFSKDTKSITEYYIPKFTLELDTLDKDKTLYVADSDHIIKPYFSKKKIENLHLFYKPSLSSQVTHSLYVSDVIKKDCEAIGLTGLNFENISSRVI